MNRLSFVFLAAMSILPWNADAAIVFDFDMDLVTPGIQNSRVAAPGEMLDVGVIMTLDGTGGPVEVSQFAFDIGFDTDFVLVTGVSIPTRPTGYQQVNPVAFNNLTGLVGTFAGGPPFGSTLVAPPNVPLHLGTVSLTTMSDSPINSTGVLLQYLNFGGDVFGSVELSQKSSTLVVTAVPEPSSLLCCAIFFSALGSRFRRRRIPASAAS